MTSFMYIPIVIGIWVICTFCCAVLRSVLLVVVLKFGIFRFCQIHSDGLSGTVIFVVCLSYSNSAFFHILCTWFFSAVHILAVTVLMVLEFIFSSSWTVFRSLSLLITVWSGRKKSLKILNPGALYTMYCCLMFVSFSDLHRQNCFVAFTDSSLLL